MRPEHVARAARFLRCDLFWLCTGEPAEYVPETPEKIVRPWGFHACEVARWLDGLPLADQERAFARIFRVCSDIHAERPLALGTTDNAKARDSTRA